MNQHINCTNNLFTQKLKDSNLPLHRGTTEILQVNLGRLCNQACTHCHQGAGPGRTEVMSLATIDRLLELLRATPSIRTVDLTGGAPEMNPHFRYFIREIKKLGLQVTDRCNLTVLHLPGQEDTAAWMAENRVNIVASLPCYGEKNVDQQRGRGVFGESIQVLQDLNQLGYGKGDLELNLVYNPVGAFLPGDQKSLEAQYRQRLDKDFGIRFSQLFTITNMPIRRFANFLSKENQYDSYLELLQNHFNPRAAEAVMCKNLVSIDYQGQVYDCDFNQAMDFGALEPDIHQLEDLDLADQAIAYGDHCFGCTAGAGSSCGGALSSEVTP